MPGAHHATLAILKWSVFPGGTFGEVPPVQPSQTVNTREAVPPETETSKSVKKKNAWLPYLQG